MMRMRRIHWLEGLWKKMRMTQPHEDLSPLPQLLLQQHVGLSKKTKKRRHEGPCWMTKRTKVSRKRMMMKVLLGDRTWCVRNSGS
jgi:hypothetical protein